jgi:hypothetical protein
LKWAFAVSVALLVLSIAANVLLGRALLTSFERVQGARIFPLGYAPSRAAKAPPTTPGSIAFWGDSRAYMWDPGTLARDRTIANFAHGGQTSSQLLLQLRTTPVLRSTFAVVQIGINDLHPLGAMGSFKPEIVATLRTNIPAIRDALLERSDYVVLTTIFPPSPVPWERKLMWDAQTLALIDEVNAVIRSAADGKRCLLLDADAILRDRNGLLIGSYADSDFFLHVNREAYVRLDAELARIVSALPYSK